MFGILTCNTECNTEWILTMQEYSILSLQVPMRQCCDIKRGLGAHAWEHIEKSVPKADHVILAHHLAGLPKHHVAREIRSDGVNFLVSWSSA